MKLNAIKDQLGRAVINISNNAKAFGISGIQIGKRLVLIL